MLLHILHDLGQVALLGALDLGAEAHGLFVHAALDDLIHAVKRAAADEEDVRRIDLNKLLLQFLFHIKFFLHRCLLHGSLLFLYEYLFIY